MDGTNPRVTVNARWCRRTRPETFVNPDSSTSLLNDRPSLRLNAVIHHPNGATFPVTVIVNHTCARRAGSTARPRAPTGWPTDGARIRTGAPEAGREPLASLVQARQTARPEREHRAGRRLQRAFRVQNDGYASGLDEHHRRARRRPPAKVVLASPDLVTPNFMNVLPPPAERYSFSLDGNAQDARPRAGQPGDAALRSRSSAWARARAWAPTSRRRRATTPRSPRASRTTTR